MEQFKNFGFALESQYSLKKAKSAKGIATIEGILSTHDIDSQGEEIFVKGMDISLLNEGMAQVNWWHLGTKDPSMIVGLFDRAVKTHNDTVIEFEAHLLDTPQAHAVLDLMNALEAEGKHIGVSVEGQVIARQDNKIYKSIARGGALATDPVNRKCYAYTTGLIKSLQGYEQTLDLTKEEMAKAIGITGNAPYNTNPILQQLSLGEKSEEKILLEEAALQLKKDYPDLSLDFIKRILINIYYKQ